MGRVLAAIDVGSNTVTSVVAERGPDGWRPLHQRAVVTRLGRGVGDTGRLDPGALSDTLAVLGEEAETARRLGAERVPAVATAAARDAADGELLVEAAEALGVELAIVSGEEEAGLSWGAVWHDFGAPGEALTVVDVGGRSTEIIHGHGPALDFRVSLPVGSVGLSERFGLLGEAAPEAAAREATGAAARAAFAGVPRSAEGGRLVAVAGTATTLMAVHLELDAYDPERVHGQTLDREALAGLADALWRRSLAERRALPGMDPPRADVLPAGAAILEAALEALGVARLTVSDRGVRWGLLYRAAGETVSATH